MRAKLQENSIVIPIQVSGASPDLKQNFQAIIDTGYAGYLSLPYRFAFPIGLVLRGQQSYTLADGSTSHHFVCIGSVSFERTSAVIPIDVQNGGPILVGVQLLRKLNLVLNVNFRDDVFELRQVGKNDLQPLPNVKINL